MLSRTLGLVLVVYFLTEAVLLLSVRRTGVGMMVPSRPPERKMSCPMENPFPRDFWFVKSKKVGGSTLAMIFRQIAERYGIEVIAPLEGRHGITARKIKDYNFQIAKNNTDLENFCILNHMKYAERVARGILNQPLKLTATREPLHRTVSHYYFTHRNRPLCEGVIDPLSNCWIDRPSTLLAFARSTANHVFNYVRGSADDPSSAFAQYDFVFVNERFDESLVAFKECYGLSYSDISYLKSGKVRTGTYASPEARSEEFRESAMRYNKKDHEFWQLAHQKLDEVITHIDETFGPGHFQSSLGNFTLLQRSIQ